MSKIVRKWVQTDWSADGALRSLDIPYSDTASITTRLDAIKDATDQSIRLQELTTEPTTETGVGKLYTENGEMYFIDENGNKIRLSKDGSIASVNRTKIEEHTEYKVLTGTDITNKYIDLNKAPDPVNSVTFSGLAGNTYEYTENFTLIRPPGTSEPDKIRLTWDSNDAGVTTGISDFVATDVVKITYNTPGQIQSDAVSRKVETYTLTSTDITNKYISLSSIANPYTSVEFIYLGGTKYFEYTEDYIVKKDSDNLYKRVSWASGDTTTGLESILAAGDVVQAIYTYSDNTQIRGTEKQLQFVTLTSTDITNKYVDLAATVASPSSTSASIMSGSELQYTEDFIVKLDDNGEYRRFSWSSSDTTTGLESVLTAGDLLRITYMDAVGLIGSTRVSRNDSSPAFLTDKIVAGNNITISVSNDGGNETLTINAASGTDKVVDQLTLTGTDISNKYVDLNNVPIEAADTEMTILGGVDQQYGVDFAVVTDGTDVKRLTWDSSNPSVITGISSLASGDILKISYVRSV